MSLSFSKLKNVFSGSRDSDSMAVRKNKSSVVNGTEALEAEVGFKMILDPNGSCSKNSLNVSEKNPSSIPELNVHIIGARHLPSKFGLKTVEGYIIKVKLFPGSTRYDTSIQTNSWPKFNETFKFPLAPALKSSIRSRTKEDLLARSPPEKLFKGHFVVLTVFALLELPPGALNPIKETYQSFKRKGSILLKEKKIIKGKSNEPDTALEDKDDEKSVFNLTKSEARRNIGSMTCYLNPKIFVENPRTGHYCTEELWMPVKDITVSGNTNTNRSALSSTKGQIEISLQICDEDTTTNNTPAHNGKSTNPFETNGNDDHVLKDKNKLTDTKSARQKPEIDIVALNNPDGLTSEENHDNNSNTNGESSVLHRTVSLPGRRSSRWSLDDVKKKIKGKSKLQQHRGGSYLVFNILRMRCSIKVKEEFELIAGDEIYLKATIFERGILSATWKSKMFAPSLSMRWDKNDAVIKIPLVNDHDIEYITIKISVATKTNVGKKIFLGTLQIGHDSTGDKHDQWEEMISSRGSAVTKWHNFE